MATAINRKGQKRLLERSNNVLKGHVLSLKYRLLAVLRHLDCGRRLWLLREQRLATAIDRKGQTRMALCCGTVSLWLLSIVLPATQFESPVCEGGLWEADSKIEGWDQSKQTKEGVPKRALRARSTVSTSLASAMAQGIARPTPTASSHEKRRATLQKARMSPSQNSWGKIEPCSAVRGGF